MTGAALIDRWSKHWGIQPEAFIRAKIEESRLHGFHPLFGLTQGSLPDDEWRPPLSSGLFMLSQIEAIEQEDFDFENGGESVFHEPPADVGTQEWRSRNARNAANARHAQPGGTRDKHRQICAFWATGKYTSRNDCAEKECAALGMSFAAARNALKNTPAPTPST